METRSAMCASPLALTLAPSAAYTEGGACASMGVADIMPQCAPVV